jgi:hypothetical protein
MSAWDFVRHGQGWTMALAGQESVEKQREAVWMAGKRDWVRDRCPAERGSRAHIANDSLHLHENHRDRREPKKPINTWALPSGPGENRTLNLGIKSP